MCLPINLEGLPLHPWNKHPFYLGINTLTTLRLYNSLNLRSHTYQSPYLEVLPSKMKPFVLALQLLGLLQLSKVSLPYSFLVHAYLGPEYIANSAIGNQSQSACTPDIATPIDGTTDSGSSSGSGGDPGAAAVASYQVAGASAIVDLTGTNLNSGFSGPADLIDLGSSPPKRKLFLKKRAALDCKKS